MTHSSIEPHFVVVQNGNGVCSMSAVTVMIHTLIITPEWDAPANTTPARRQWWRQIQTSIVSHEHHHSAITDQNGAMLADSLQALQPMRCADLQLASSAVYNRRIALWRNEQEDFDKSQANWRIPPIPP